MSTGFALSELQAAIYTALSADSGLTTSLGGAGKIFDHVPESAEAPYVTIGDNTAKEWGACTFDGMESTYTIHTWTLGQGRRGAHLVMKEIYRVLHEAHLTMSTQAMVSMRHEFATVDLDPDGATYHGIQRFRVFTQGV